MPHTKSKPKNTLAFTLVELIVVVTILAILATIGFVSYSSYLTGVRDTNRLAQLVSISDGLELYSTKNNLPLPDDNVEVQANGTTIAYQGYAGANTLETIDFTKGGKDPRDDQYFTYYLTKDRKYFQLMGFLEESVDISTRNTQNNNSQNSLNIINSTHAVDYTDRIPSVYGKKLGILTDTTNTPIQEISSITSVGLLNLTSGTTGYTAHLNDETKLTDTSLLSINPKASCKRIKQMRGGSQDGVYEINPTGADGAEFEVYCDMTTDGGGWTLVGKTDGGDVNIFHHLSGTAWSANPSYNSVMPESGMGINQGWEIHGSGYKLCRGGMLQCMTIDLLNAQVKERCGDAGYICPTVNSNNLSLKDIFTNDYAVWLLQDNKTHFNEIVETLGVGPYTRSGYTDTRHGCGINIGGTSSLSRKYRIGCVADLLNNNYDDYSVGIGISSCGNGGCAGTTTPNFSTYLYYTELENAGVDPEINYIWVK